ncbi:MAG: phosphopantetheine-binding protein [Myxococcota bacterium]|jgi:acyl carrier protein|nr:phosphopantetheine-binding protein [Myxococcota bacterium]
MSDATELRLQVKQLIVESLNLEDIDPEEIEDEQPLFGAGLELDSLDALQLAVAIEERFGVPITDEDMGQKVFASVKALAEFVSANGGAA